MENATMQWVNSNRSKILKYAEKNGLTLKWFETQKPRLASVLTTIKLYGKRYLSTNDVNFLYSIRNFIASFLLNEKETICSQKQGNRNSTEHLRTLIMLQKIIR